MKIKNPLKMWLKYYLTAVVFGIAIETIAAASQVYRFKKVWLIPIVVIFFWGGIIGTLAMITRTKNSLRQFLPGFFILSLAEILNDRYLNLWFFPEQSFLHQQQPIFRAIILGIGTGIISLAIIRIRKKIAGKIP